MSHDPRPRTTPSGAPGEEGDPEARREADRAVRRPGRPARRTDEDDDAARRDENPEDTSSEDRG
ncbi:hypothetical protein ACN20G_30470 (plasmid) [Streptomyces sp. BI20]|uniref:hypothetical protein n=1 Tax=Streptomyces sp. BI20 TaxID=3403460 RepID=UPI003C78EBFF